MRIGSKPACWKKRLSSIEVTASHQDRGDVVELHHAALLAVGAGELVMSCGSSWY